MVVFKEDIIIFVLDTLADSSDELVLYSLFIDISLNSGETGRE